MRTPYILGVLAIAFMVAALTRGAVQGFNYPQTRTWLLIGVIFGVVSAYLFYQEQ